MNRPNELYIGKVTKEKTRARKVDGQMRIYVGDLFRDGDKILFIRDGNDVYLLNSNKILGSGVVSSKRVRINKEVAKLLDLTEDDYTAIERSTELNQEFKTNLRLAKAEFRLK